RIVEHLLQTVPTHHCVETRLHELPHVTEDLASASPTLPDRTTLPHAPEDVRLGRRPVEITGEELGHLESSALDVSEEEVLHFSHRGRGLRVRSSSARTTQVAIAEAAS